MKAREAEEGPRRDREIKFFEKTEQVLVVDDDEKVSHRPVTRSSCTRCLHIRYDFNSIAYSKILCCPDHIFHVKGRGCGIVILNFGCGRRRVL